MQFEEWKQSCAYKKAVGPIIWNYLIPMVHGTIRARWWLHDLTNVLAFTRMAQQDGALLTQARAQHEREFVNLEDPLISITIATYNRAEILVNRTLPSVLSQTYKNFEVVVVGDHCTDDTAQRLAALGDPRVRFFNLPERPAYPADGKKRWQIAGVEAFNLACEMARGLWLAHLDDDEVFTRDHLEKLLSCAQAGDYEFVSARSRIETRPGHFIERGSPLFRNGGLSSAPVGPIMNSTALYRTYLRLFKADTKCLDYGLNGDGFRMRRMFNAGVRAGFVNQVLTLQPLRPGQTQRESWHAE